MQASESEIQSWRDALTSDRDGLTTGWLARSFDEPDGFFTALLRMASEDNSAVPLKSVYGASFDIYHDAVVRHAGADNTALRWYHRERGWQNLSYRELHQRCTRLGAAWQEAGVGPGAIVAVVLPMGVDFVIALLTGFCLGACVCPLPPLGRDYSFTRRLAGLAPTHVATDMTYHSALGEYLDMLLPDASSASLAPGQQPVSSYHSHSYATGEICALVYAPLRDPTDVPVELSCDDAYLRALRDGHLHFRLGAGDSLAAPGFPELQYQPALVLATLLAGATYVHIDMRAIEAVPERILDLQLGNLGVGAELRELLMHARGPGKPRWRQWFRNPEEDCDYLAWQDFVDRFALAETPVCNLIVDAAVGGALLFARAPSGTEHLRAPTLVRPAPGIPWALLDAGQMVQESVQMYGVFAHGPDQAMVTHILMSRYRGLDYLYMGPVEPRRAGWVYPRAEVVQAIAELAYVQAASVVAEAYGDAVSYRFVLLVFTGHDQGTTPEVDVTRGRELAARISGLVGEPFMPDHIRVLPLYARLADGAADDAWCALQYRQGLLQRKSQMPLYTHLTTLRATVQREESG